MLKKTNFYNKIVFLKYYFIFAKIFKMVKIGKYNNLRIVKEVDFGLYLDGGEEYGEILLPIRYVSPTFKVDDVIEVFIYFDSEDRIIATTEMPITTVGEFALLKVLSVNKIGVFLDWGLPKDVLVPFREQKKTMEVGKYYFVYLYVDDKTNRIVASSKLDKFLSKDIAEYEENEEVDIFVTNKTDIGYKAIVNNTYWGLLFNNEVFKPLDRGLRTKAYIKQIRDDGKIDISLEKPGFEKIEGLAKEILNSINANNGFISINDKSSPQEIYQMFGISKKNFKKAVGTLYKLRKIKIEKNGIRLGIKN